MSRVDFKIFQAIQEVVGDHVSLEIGSTGEVQDGRDDYKFAVTFLTLRFGYWQSLEGDRVQAINTILDEKSLEMVIDYEDYDDDCGWKVSYKIVKKTSYV